MEAVAARHDEAHAAHIEHELSFFRRYVFSTDHKIIGIQYIITSLVMALIAGWMAMLIRMQLAWPGREWPLLGQLLPGAFPDGVMRPDFYYALVTMHGTIMVFFFLTTLLSGGFGNYLIPLQIGARDMAFPFLNALSYWLVPPAILVLMAAFFVEGGAPGSGWTAYAPLSAVQGAAPGSGLGQSLWLFSLAILMISFLMGSLNYITTVLNLRARGMSMMRLPLTVWSLFIAAILSLLAFPVLTAAAIMLLFDRHAGTSFFLPEGLVIGDRLLQVSGGDPLLWQHLFWFLGHPEVYIVILPAMGIVSEVLATNARKPIFGYPFMVGSLMAIAFLSFIVWGHHMFASGMHPLLGTVFMLTTLLVAVPSAVKTFNWLATLWQAKIRFTTAMLFAIGFVSLFVTGGLTGVVLGSPAVNTYVHDTYFVVAHFHLVMGTAALFGIFAGIYHWFPKMFGRFMDERLGQLHFWLSILGVYGTFFPMHFLGTAGMMRRVFSIQSYAYLQPLQVLNVVITVAAMGLVLAQLIFAVNFVVSTFRGARAPKNPWQATSLEWQADSPPPHGNWGAEAPVVHRWPYDYSLPGVAEDYVPQTVPIPETAGAEGGETA